MNMRKSSMLEDSIIICVSFSALRPSDVTIVEFLLSKFSNLM